MQFTCVDSNIHLAEFLTLQPGTAVHFVTVQATNLSNIIFVHMKMCLSTGCWRKYLASRDRKYQEGRKNCEKRSFIIILYSSLHIIGVIKLMRIGRVGQSLQKWEMHTKFYVESMKEILSCRCDNNIKIIFKNSV